MKPSLPDFAAIDKLVDSARLTQADYDLIADALNQNFVVENGTIKFIPLGHYVENDIAHIDWINFTVSERTIEQIDTTCLSDNDLIIEYSRILHGIFGYGITSVRPNGAYFYQKSFELGNQYGLVCYCGQNHTILVSISANGLTHAADGWQNRLYKFLINAVMPTITRIDLAHDDYEPEFYTVDNMLYHFRLGGFKNGKRMPSVSQAGNWVTPDDKGRTLYIGRRTNGLFCRIYEKGLQLESKEHPRWVRCEVEFKSVDRILPFEILLRPHHYLAGSFPVFNVLNTIQSKVQTFQHEVNADFNHRVKWGKRQQGSLIQLLQQLEFNDSQIVSMLKADRLPKEFERRFLPSFKQSIHEAPRPVSVPLDYLGENETFITNEGI